MREGRQQFLGCAKTFPTQGAPLEQVCRECAAVDRAIGVDTAEVVLVEKGARTGLHDEAYSLAVNDVRGRDLEGSGQATEVVDLGEGEGHRTRLATPGAALLRAYGLV